MMNIYFLHEQYMKNKQLNEQQYQQREQWNEVKFQVENMILYANDAIQNIKKPGKVDDD